MKRIRVFTAVILLAMTSGCGGTSSPPAPTARPVTVEKIGRHTVVKTIVLPGDVRANLSAQLFAKVSGYLETILVDKGDKVRAGQLLARIRLPEMAHEHARTEAASARGGAEAAASRARLPAALAAMQSAQADVGRARAQQSQLHAEMRRSRAALAQSSAELDLAQKTYTRMKGMYDEDQGLLAKQDLDIAEARLRVAQEKVREARDGVTAAADNERAGQDAVRAASARVRAMEAEIHVARDEATGARLGHVAAEEEAQRTGALLGYTEISAPFDGTVTDRFLDPGALVQSAEGSAQGATVPVMAVADYDVVRVRVQVPQEDAPHIHRGTPAHVRVDAWGERAFAAPVARVAEALSAGTRTMLAEVDVRNRDHALKPGMFAQVTLDVESHRNTVAVPTRAIVIEKQTRSVFVVLDGKARKIAIETGFENRDWTEVKDGLKGGETVVVIGQDRLSDGAAVTTR